MSYFVCSCCKSKEYIFGKHGARDKAKEMGLDFLGEVPLDTHLRSSSDEGKPIPVIDPSSEFSRIYLEIAKKVVSKLEDKDAQQQVKIVIE